MPLSHPPLRRTALGATALLALALATTTAAAPAGADDATARRTLAPAALTHPTSSAHASKVNVTLVTGDRVTVTTLADGKTVNTVTPAPGNNAPIRTTTIGKRTFVFPQNAIPYLAAGLVDEDLFDVTSLIDQGYDDAHQRALPLIVQYAKGAPISGAASTPDAALRRDLLPSIHGASIAAPRKQSTAFWSSVTAGTAAHPRLADGITKLWLDGRVEADLADSTAQVGAPQAWADGYNGTGAEVAVLDTGIDADHPDLKDQIVASQSFVPGEDTADHFGHGTHVASTIAGTGAASNGVEKGVAWGAHLAVGKVLGNDGFGQDSWIIAGMQWAATQAPVVNMSLGTQEISDGTDPISQAANDLSQSNGTLFVVSAGNQGCETCLGAPAAAQDALTVGSVDSTDTLSWFSSMGPRAGDAGMKPDLVAPGENILAARSSLSADGEGFYTTMSGTSMAAPHVAGAAAIIAQRHPAWTGQQIKDALVSAAHGLDGYTPYQVGTGRLDIPAALGDVHATGSVSFGFFPWPHNADTAVTHTVTYSNDGADPVTLDLSTDVRDGSGTPAPDGAVALSADQVTVPAGGSTTVDVTGDPNAVTPGTRLSGTLVASANGTPVTRTSLGMEVEAERYNMTINLTDRNGQAPAPTYVMVHEKNDWDPSFYQVTGTTTLRLPPGTYSVMTVMELPEAPGQTSMVVLGDPEVKFDSDTTVDLDAQEANPITVKSPRPGAVATWRLVQFYISAGMGLTQSIAVPDTDQQVLVQPTDPVTDGTFELDVRWRLRRPYLSVNVGGQPVETLMALDSGWVKAPLDTTLAYAGNGSSADFDAADVHGKIAVMTLPADTYDFSAYTAAAYAHGAKALVIVNDQPGPVNGFAGPTYGVQAAIPVATASGAVGQTLVPQAQAGAAASLGGGENSPYVYDLMHEVKGQVPDSIHYEPKQRDLARIDTRFLSYRHQEGGEIRCEFPSWAQYCSGFPQHISFPSTRVDYVSTEPGTSWWQGALTIDSNWDMRSDRMRYHAGQHAHEDWFGPVVSPRFGTGYYGPGRQVDWLDINIPSFADSSPGHTGGMDSAITHQLIKLYRGKKLLQTSTGWQAMFSHEPMPAKRLKYRVTSDATRSGYFWGTSTRTHTEWSFWSHHASPDVFEDALPMLSLQYRIHTDVRSQAPAGHRVRIGFNAYHQVDATDAGRIAGGSLKVSYDHGRHWTRVKLTGKAGHWVGHLDLPRNASRTVSLRGAAWDSHGNTVSQTVMQAVLLR